MKFNWKVLVALVVLAGAIFWAIDSQRTRSYSGIDLNFDVGNGPVTVTNSTNTAVPVQLTSTGTRMFTVSSISESISGRSVRQGSGRTATQLFEVDLPPGITELIIVARSAAVNFVADTGSRLAATVQPMTGDDARTTTIVAAVIIVGTLFYLSRATDHRWITLIRREKAAV